MKKTSLKLVSKWTGIPVTQMMEGETQKLVNMEERIHERMVDQEEAVTDGFRGHPAQPGRFERSQASYWQLHVSGTYRCRQDRVGAQPGLVPFR